MRQGQARQGGGGEEQEKGDQQRFPLSSSSSKLLRFFPRAIAPFTGRYVGHGPLVTGCVISCDTSFCDFITCNVRLVVLGTNKVFCWVRLGR